MNDILNLGDVKKVVDCFYDKVRNDEQLKDVFNNVIQDRWDAHLEKMYRFWQTVLLEEHTYYGSPFPPHANLPVNQKHFDTWLGLWYESIDESFAGTKADEAKWRGDKMAAMFLSKINYYKSSTAIPLA
mgnify:CR=1 FL=1